MGGCLFRLPRRNFESDSDVFRDMFALPFSTERDPEGSSPENPLHLEGITKEDFESLLDVMFPLYVYAHCFLLWTEATHLDLRRMYQKLRPASYSIV